eukprot:jgi/Phyca11/98299/e_gw1.2.1173.1
MVRIRPGTRSRSAAVAAIARDIDLGHFWRQLKAAGWKSKRPIGIQTEWRYVSPDGSKVFVGEAEVVAYALKAGILSTDESRDNSSDADNENLETGENTEAQQASPIDAGNSELADESIRASQIDTSTHLSQNTMNELFGTPSDAEDDLSQGAVTRAFDMSQSDPQLEDSQEAAASLQLLSEASGRESD